MLSQNKIKLDKAITVAPFRKNPFNSFNTACLPNMTFYIILAKSLFAHVCTSRTFTKRFCLKSRVKRVHEASLILLVIASCNFKDFMLASFCSIKRFF